ncbi:MAG TPA: hypothetical protein VGS07_05345 [Thermoanaerobaculia bacterium]|nr:hypothetical protein [Thermoanaerobaculia bacterium]
MQPQAQAAGDAWAPEAEAPAERAVEERWSLLKRVAFRFLFSYFVLFFLTGQEVAGIPFSEPLVEKYTKFWYGIAVWIGKHLLHIKYDIVMNGDGSGDTTFQWILLPCYLTLAAAVTMIWSVLDRRRPNYKRLYAWFRLLLRFSLATALIVYGIVKVIPNQMPTPRSFTLLQRVGELEPMRMLWTFIGASPAFETFTGLAELLAGLLLLVPRTTLLGVLICVADMTMVFMMNMCYDVPVKIMSFHYLVMGILLVAPDLRRLADLFLFNRPVGVAETRPLFTRKRLDQAVQILFVVFGLYMIYTSVSSGIKRYEKRNPPKPPLYGVWSVEELTVDGKDVPLATATPVDRWRWVTLEKPGEMRLELKTGAHESYAISLDRVAKKMTLAKYQKDLNGKPVLNAAGKPQKDPNWQGNLSFNEPETDVLVLDGTLDGHRTHAKLLKMPLIGKSFHWIIDPTKE